MDDLISRQAAIDALRQQAETMSEWSNRYAEQRKGVLTAVNIVEDLPPAQLGTDLAEVGTDCISREQAIEICDHAIDLLKGQFGAGALVAIKESIEELPPAQPHWIPVTERLPEIRHDVLFTVFFHETWRTMQGYRQDGEFMFWYNGRLESALDDEHRVSAWMPLPEPFREVTT